jgi:hypothetical protein
MTDRSSTTDPRPRDGIQREPDVADSPPKQPDIAPPKDPDAEEPNVWLREGADAPDAADIEDPKTQL